MSLTVISCFAAAGLAILLGFALFLHFPRKLANTAFLFGMALLGAESYFTGRTLLAESIEQVLALQSFRLWATSLLPCAWLLFAVSYARGNSREFLAKWWPVAALAGALALVLVSLHGKSLWGLLAKPVPPYDHYVGFTWPAFALHCSLLVGVILVLMHLERTLRTSVGTMRWRIKFTMLGLLMLFGVRLYTASQTLLSARLNLGLQKVDTIALLLSCVLIAFSFGRAGFAKADVYPSPSVLQRSVAVLLAGLYLLVVGGVAQLISVFGGDSGFGFRVLFVLLSLVVLGALALSERVREYLRRFISRNLQRPHHDYRHVWTTFAERTSLIMDKGLFCQAVARWICDTFNVLSVTVWLVDERKKKVLIGASTAVPKTPALPLLLQEEESAGIIQHLQQTRSPVDLDSAQEAWADAIKRATVNLFPTGGRRICVPLMAGNDLVGFITLGDRVNGVTFTYEDFELLQCIGNQAASNLVTFQLSQKLLQAKQMEAFQAMAAFFVHDLKNMGSTLSLMLQNLGVHYDNPEFRQDALRSLTRTVEHLNSVISRLSLIREQLTLTNREADLNELVEIALRALAVGPGIRVARKLEPLPPLWMDAEQIRKVLSNLLVNAVEAVNGEGEVTVETSRRDGWACVSISDTGHGMSPEFVANSLFRPFQTTKKKGIGIGVFLSKVIVDAHSGKLEVDTHPGKGTSFRVLLPLKQPEDPRT